MNTGVTSEGVAATRVTEDLDFGIAREAVLDLLLGVLRYEFVFLAREWIIIRIETAVASARWFSADPG